MVGAVAVLALFRGMVSGLVLAESVLRLGDRGRTTLDRVHALEVRPTR